MKFLNKNVIENILIFVYYRYLASGMSQFDISLAFRIGSSTVPTIIADTCQAIWNVLKNKVMPKPDKEKCLEIAKGFEERWNFPHVIGS